MKQLTILVILWCAFLLQNSPATADEYKNTAKHAYSEVLQKNNNALPVIPIEYNKKYSFDTYIFLSQADNNVLKKQYFIQKQNEVEYTKVFIKIDNNYSYEALNKINCKEIIKTQSVALVYVPIKQIPALTKFDFIEKIEIATQAKPLLDSTLSKVNANLVHNGTNLKNQYFGKDVIVGIVDYGVDFTHPMFLDENGNSRVKRVWIPLGEVYSPPVPFNEGTLYTDSNYIKNVLKYSSRSNHHASHVLGIIAGSKVKTVNTELYYSGVAAKSDIAVVECEGGVITLNEALCYLFSYADSVAKPIVVNMSLGTTGGPCDGKTLEDIQMSEILNQNPEGHILVVSAGNSGNSNFHIYHKFEEESQSINVYQQFMPVEGYQDYNMAQFSIWGEKGDDFDVSVYISEDSNYPQLEHVVDISSYEQTYTDGYVEFSYDCPAWIDILAESVPSYEGNGKPYISIYFLDRSYEIQEERLPWKVTYKITSKNNTNSTVHCWNMQRYRALLSDDEVADSYYSLGSPGTVPEVITVGAYISRDTLKTLAYGNYPNVAGILDDIANFSSKGPLTDGTIKPDITAPGSLVYSAYNYYDTVNKGTIVDYVEDSETNNIHIIHSLQGTSMSCPVVSGIVALMLELNSKLTQSEIKDILRITALNDEFTGNAKENKSIVWGWGKIDAMAIMRNLEGNAIYEKPDFELDIYPNPAPDGKLNIRIQNETNMPFVINIYDVTGKLVYLSSILTEKQIDLSNLPAGTYFIEIYNDKAKAIQKIVL